MAEPNEYDLTDEILKEIIDDIGYRPNDLWTKIYAIVCVVLALKKRGII